MTYPAEFRHRACLALHAAGYPDRHNSLRDTAALLGVPRHTLRRWFHATPLPPPSPDQILQPVLQHELTEIFASMERKRDDANYAQLTRALAQLVDLIHRTDFTP